jgi:hypothetical protein
MPYSEVSHCIVFHVGGLPLVAADAVSKRLVTFICQHLFPTEREREQDNFITTSAPNCYHEQQE